MIIDLMDISTINHQIEYENIAEYSEEIYDDNNNFVELKFRFNDYTEQHLVINREEYRRFLLFEDLYRRKN